MTNDGGRASFFPPLIEVGFPTAFSVREFQVDFTVGVSSMHLSCIRADSGKGAGVIHILGNRTASPAADPSAPLLTHRFEI
jgi:hypothetical protein